MILRAGIDYDEQDIDWLDCLIAAYERVRRHDPDAREDPGATAEMIAECRRLADRLRAALPEREPQEAAVVDPDMPF